MTRFKLIGTNVATALVTALVVSIFWIALYSADDDAPPPAMSSPEAAAPQGEIAIGPNGLAVPVAGVTAAELVDTYTQSRAGGARVHNAIDIMAPTGTPVVAAAPGTVEKLFYSSGGGGITAYVRSPDGGWIFYYAHLDAYAPGLAEGQKIERGDVIGTVGTSGNAAADGPHLHFAIHRMQRGESWHEGSPINPYPLLAGGGARG